MIGIAERKMLSREESERERENACGKVPVSYAKTIKRVYILENQRFEKRQDIARSRLFRFFACYR